MFTRGGQIPTSPSRATTNAPEVPIRRNRKGLSTSGHNLNAIGQQKYDRDALAFNHYLGFFKQPLRRHLSSDITYLVPSMPIPVVPTTTVVDSGRPITPTATTLSTPTNRPYGMPMKPATMTMTPNPEQARSAPRRQRTFRKQKSLDNPSNESSGYDKLSPVTGPSVQATGLNEYSSGTSTSVPHLPLISGQSNSPQNPVLPLNPSKPMSLSTEGLIQHIISQQSQIERLSKQQDFLTQQLILSRELDLGGKRRGHSRGRSRSTSRTHPGTDSLSSLEPAKRSSSREKIQEQLHAQQARVQQHIQQLEAQLELIRDIRTGSSQPNSRSHSRAASLREGSTHPIDGHLLISSQSETRPLSADPRVFKAKDSNRPDQNLSSSNTEQEIRNQTEGQSKDLFGVREPTPTSPQSTVNKPRLILTNPSEESKENGTSIESRAENGTKLMVNRPTLLDQDDGIPFVDDEVMDDGPEDDSDELETVFEFNKDVGLPQERSDSGFLPKIKDDDDYEEDEYGDWEDEEIDFYSRDMASPEADLDPWAQLMEEDIMRARGEMDRQRQLMERQEMDLADQRQQFTVGQPTTMDEPLAYQRQVSKSPAPNVTIIAPRNTEGGVLTTPETNRTSYFEPHQGTVNQSMVNQSTLPRQTSNNLVPLIKSTSRSPSPGFLTMRQQQQPIQHQQNVIRSGYGDDGYHNPQSGNNYDRNETNFTGQDMVNQQSLGTNVNNPLNYNQTSKISPQQQSASLFKPYVNQPSVIDSPMGRLSDIGSNQVTQSALWSNNQPTVTTNSNNIIYGVNSPPKIVDRQISIPIAMGQQQPSPDTNHLKRPSFEGQSAHFPTQSSILRSKLIQSPVNLSTDPNQIPFQRPNLLRNFQQPSAPPRRKPVTPRTLSPVSNLMNTNSNQPQSYRIQTNKNRMAGHSMAQQSRQQKQFNTDTFFNHQPLSSQSYNQQPQQSPNLNPSPSKPDNRLPVQMNFQLKPNQTPYQPTLVRPESQFRPIVSSPQPKIQSTPPIIKIEPARSQTNLNLMSASSRRSPSPQPKVSSSTSFIKRAGSFIQRNTILGNKRHSKQPQQPQSQLTPQQQQQLQVRRSPSPTPLLPVPDSTNPRSRVFNNPIALNTEMDTLKIDMQSIRSRRSSLASSPVPPVKERSPVPKPTRKVFMNKDTVDAGSFVDHFNHYYAPQTEKQRRPLSQQFTHISTGDLTKVGRSVTPLRDTGKSMESDDLRRAPSIKNKLENQSTANALIDAPIQFERRQTLPEIPKGLGIEDLAAKEEATLRAMAGKKKHSLPQNDLHEVPLIPGWEREKVATLAHEAREARLNQRKGAAVHIAAATNWLLRYKLIALIVFFNGLLFYLFMRILQPIELRDDKSQ